jgi:hypothetical protein
LRGEDAQGGVSGQGLERGVDGDGG